MLREALKGVEQRWPGRLEINALHEPIPGYECPPDQPFIPQMESICQTPAETVNYCTEAPFLQQLCPTLVLGPGSIEQAHQPNEYLEHKFIQPTLDILSKAIKQYCF